MILNSFFLFVSAYIITKLSLAFVKFIVIRSFGGKTLFKGFYMECVNHSSSPIWTQVSVLSIYLANFITALLIGIFSYILYTYFKRLKGFMKLWLLWVYIIAVNQSLGSFIRDIPFKRDIFHALNWMYIPYEAMVVFSALTIIPIFFIYRNNLIKFLRMSSGKVDFLLLPNRRKFYSLIGLIPGLLGLGFILLTHIHKIKAYEYIEVGLFLFALLIPYLFLLKKQIFNDFRIAKGNKPGAFSIITMLAFVISVATYFYLKNRYY